MILSDVSFAPLLQYPPLGSRLNPSTALLYALTGFFTGASFIQVRADAVLHLGCFETLDLARRDRSCPRGIGCSRKMPSCGDSYEA